MYFAPTSPSTQESSDLGLLSRIALTPCLLEPFRNAPTTTEIKDCLLKLLSVHADLQRRAQRNETETTLTDSDLPKLWILASSVSGNLLKGFAATSHPAWPQGIYALGEILCTWIISINQLPQTEDTLWLRLLGKGITQAQAIAEILAFPNTDPRRDRTLQLLAGWKITLELNNPVNDEDEERGVLMVLSQAYLEWEKTTKESGIQEGIQAERRATLENLFKARFGTIDDLLADTLQTALALSTEEYTQLLLELPQLSKDELIAKFLDNH